MSLNEDQFANYLEAELEELEKSETQIKDKEQALIYWYLREVYYAEPIDIFDSFTGASDDQGLDAIYITDEVIIIIQGKTGGKRTSNFPKNAIIKTLKHGIEWLEREDFREGNPQVKARAEEFLDARENYLPVHVVFLGMGEKPTSTSVSDAFLNSENREDYKVEYFVFSDLMEQYNRSLIQSKKIDVELELHDTPYQYNENNIRTRIATVSAKEIARIHNLNDNSKYIYSRNIRNSLGYKIKINQGIINTATNNNQSQFFWYYNNGIVVTCDEFNFISARTKKITLKNFQIVNGCQTVSSLAKGLIDGELEDDVYLLIKIIENPDSEFVRNITRYTNSQSAIKPSDFVSNDPIQIKIHLDVRELGYFYENYRGAFGSIQRSEKITEFGKNFRYKLITKEKAAQAYMAFLMQRPAVSRVKRGELLNPFSDAGYYESIRENMKNPTDEIFYSYRVYQLIENRKSMIRKGLNKIPIPNNVIKLDWALQADYTILALFFYVYYDKTKVHDKLYLKSFFEVIESDFENKYKYIIKIVTKEINKKRKDMLYSHTKYFKSRIHYDELKTKFTEDKTIVISS